MKNHLEKYIQLHKDILCNLRRLKEVKGKLQQTRGSLMFCYDDEEDGIFADLSHLHEEEKNLWTSLENAIQECGQIDLALGHDIVEEREQ